MKEYKQYLRTYLEIEGYTYIASEDEFNEMYPPMKYGEYRPQPEVRPYSYPSMILELHIIDSSWCDKAILSILPIKE